MKDNSPRSGNVQEIRQAVVLAGGFGTRLGPLTADTPKPMLTCGDRPFLDSIIWNLMRHGIADIVLSVCYLAETVMDHYGDGERFGVRIRYYKEDKPAGTLGALQLAKDLLQDEFFALNGDTLFDMNYLDLELFHRTMDLPASMALRRLPDAGRYGRAIVQDGVLQGFEEKGASTPGVVNAGIYILRRELLDNLPGAPSSIEKDAFPLLAAQGKIGGKEYEGYFLDIGLPETHACAQQAVPDWRRKKAVIFDRDGVLNIDHGYVHKPADFDWIEGAKEAVKHCNDRGMLAFVATNQAGIARGYYDEATFQDLCDFMRNELRAVGAHIDAIYHCPHHPTQGKGDLLQQCDCRKPGPGMIRCALDEWNIKASDAVFIGDKPSDMGAAENAGVRGLLFPGGNLLDFITSALPSE